MRKPNLRILLVVFLFPMLCWAQEIQVKEDAPEKYIVQSGDTLWDISNLFLSEPWKWPELWRTNTQILNPHLIYPGDVLRLIWQDGKPTMTVDRPDKRKMSLSPNSKTTTKEAAIPLLSRSAIAPYLNNDMIMTTEEYDRLPHILGNNTGDIRFVSDDIVLARAKGNTSEQFSVVRKQDTLYDRFGNEIGIQVRHVADGRLTDVQPKKEWLVKVSQSNYEAKRGDKLYIMPKEEDEQFQLLPAKSGISGEVVSNLHQRTLLGKHDVVVVDLGSADVKAGTVLGLYMKGPTIFDGENPQYDSESHALKGAFNDGNTIQQPALKIGQAVVFKTFDKASYAIITKATEMVKQGTIVSAP